MKETTTATGRTVVRLNFLDLVSFQREGWDLQSHEFRKVRKQSKKNTGQIGSLRRAVIVKGLFLGRL